jgi:hypothetical protein
MAIKIEIFELPDPQLEFGGVGEFSDPKIGLRDGGPYDLRFGTARKSRIDIGFIGTEEMVERGNKWLNRCQKPIESIMGNKAQYPNYPGFEDVFRANFNFNHKWNHVIDSAVFDKVIAEKDSRIVFKNILDLYSDGLEAISKLESLKPSVIFCCLPDEVIDRCWSIENDKVKKDDKKKIKSLSIGAQLQIQFGNDLLEDIEEREEDLLRRDFRRALKARAMRFGIPIQIGTDNLFLDLPKNQDASIRAWNSSIALYYKAGGIPWRLRKDGPDTCYVGISFHHLYTTHDRHLVRSCIAQAFSSDGEGFAIRGVNIPWSEGQGRNVHLTFDQSYQLGEKILQEYVYRTGGTPLRVVLHKSSEFNYDEKEGLYAALHNVPIVELVYLAPTDFRLVRFGDYPPKRGTMCVVNNDAAFLFNTGFMPELKTYPGPHIPVPIRIKVDNDADIMRTASDVLALSRMNWNTASITGGTPVTLFFSKKVGGIMSEFGEEQPPSSFRFYI